MKTWTLVTAVFDSSPDDWSWVNEIFEQNGVSGTIEGTEPPSLGGYVYDASQLPDLINALRESGAARVETEDIEEEDWSIAWRKFFHTRRVGSRIVIRPAWEEADHQPDDIEIVLDPGQAFGTGDHPTTRMCLELLELEAIDGKTVADIGCGSGILSVAAVKLGASAVVGVDVEKQSVDASRENADRNGVTFDVFEGEGFNPLGDATYDFVLSNIISAALIRLAPEASTRVREGGKWIVSGIIAPNWEDVRVAAERVGFILEAEREEGEWVAATFRR